MIDISVFILELFLFYLCLCFSEKLKQPSVSWLGAEKMKVLRWWSSQHHGQGLSPSVSPSVILLNQLDKALSLHLHMATDLPVGVKHLLMFTMHVVYMTASRSQKHTVDTRDAESTWQNSSGLCFTSTSYDKEHQQCLQMYSKPQRGPAAWIPLTLFVLSDVTIMLKAPLVIIIMTSSGETATIFTLMHAVLDKP